MRSKSVGEPPIGFGPWQKPGYIDVFPRSFRNSACKCNLVLAYNYEEQGCERHAWLRGTPKQMNYSWRPSEGIQRKAAMLTSTRHAGMTRRCASRSNRF